MLERGASPRHLAGRVGGRRRAATEFIFMFTQNDITRSDALEVYDAVRSVEGLKFLGFKNIGLGFEDYQALVGAARRDQRRVFLEVISDSESATLEAARLGVELGVDYLIGTFPE